MQSALDEIFPYALGLFESYDGENALVEDGITVAESEIRQLKDDRITGVFSYNFV